LDLDGAAGVGQLDVVKSFFNKDGSLKAKATRKQMTDGFSWACGCGRTAVVDFLLKHGMDVAAPLGRSGTTGLHCAAYGGHVDTVRLLLERKAPVDAIEREWNNTPLGWALHSWGESRTSAEREPYYQVVVILVAAGATVRSAVLEWSKVRANRRMLRALRSKAE
jgi:ankyrin repeat protein